MDMGKLIVRQILKKIIKKMNIPPLFPNDDDSSAKKSSSSGSAATQKQSEPVKKAEPIKQSEPIKKTEPTTTTKVEEPVKKQSSTTQTNANTANTNSLKTLFNKFEAIIVLDTETSGLDPNSDSIIELAAICVQKTMSGAITVSRTMDEFIKLPEGKTLDPKITQLTGITSSHLITQGVYKHTAAAKFINLISGFNKILIVAHNAHFDISFLNKIFEQTYFKADISYLDTLTVFKDRRKYPHRLESAIQAYNLQDKIHNNHRAIDDVYTTFEVLKAMDNERADLDTYVNIFGYNPKYGYSGKAIEGITYKAQEFSNFMRSPSSTLPALIKQEKSKKMYDDDDDDHDDYDYHDYDDGDDEGFYDGDDYAFDR